MADEWWSIERGPLGYPKVRERQVIEEQMAQNLIKEVMHHMMSVAATSEEKGLYQDVLDRGLKLTKTFFCIKRILLRYSR